jgi:hypothetical protein
MVVAFGIPAASVVFRGWNFWYLSQLPMGRFYASYYLLATDQAEAAEQEIQLVLRDDPLNKYKAFQYRLGVCRLRADRSRTTSQRYLLWRVPRGAMDRCPTLFEP